MLDRHHQAIFGGGGHLQVAREPVGLHHQGVVPAGLERRGESPEDALGAMMDRRSLAVDGLRCPVHRSPERHPDGLVTKAHPEHRRPLVQQLDQVVDE